MYHFTHLNLPVFLLESVRAVNLYCRSSRFAGDGSSLTKYMKRTNTLNLTSVKLDQRLASDTYSFLSVVCLTMRTC